MNEDVDFLTTCKQCHGKALAHNITCNESPTSPLHLQVPEYQNLMTVTKGSRSNVRANISATMTATKGSRTNVRANFSDTMTASKGSRSNIRALDTRSETKQAASESSSAAKSRRKTCSWGIIWKKKNKDGSADTSSDFRLNNILLRGGLGMHRMEPQCNICRKPYRPDLMYICCQTCKSMFIQSSIFSF